MKETRMNRRQAGKILLGGVGGVVLDFQSSAAAAAFDSWPEFSFLVVTDTHIGYKNGTAAEKRWRSTAAELKDAQGDFVLHLGDLVDRGNETQYPVYTKIRDTIGKPFYEIPGNHDPESLFKQYIDQKIDRSFDHGGVRFLLFNNARTDSHDGFITSEQIAWLKSELEDAATANLRVIVCAHVPFHYNRHPDRGWYVKPDNGQTAFYELIEAHSDRVLAIFHGHFHNGIRGWDDRRPVHEILFPSALYNLDRGLMAKEAPGYNLPEFRPGYVLATFTGGKLILKYHVTGEADDGSIPEKALTW